MIEVQKKENRKKFKQEKIINAAAELFARKNYHEVMMEDVAKLVSVAKGTVYNYFNSKEDLYFSIMENTARKIEFIIEREDPVRIKYHRCIKGFRNYSLFLYDAE